MKVLEPKELEDRRKQRAKKHKSKKAKRSSLPILLLVATVYAVGALLVPLPSLRVEMAEIPVPTAETIDMPWPGYGEAAIGAVGYGMLAENGEQKQLPIASVAKVITAIAVLKQHPLQLGESGEMLTITAQDEQTYRQYLAQYQSVVPVEQGQELTLYQAMQALLLPSANNMADILVRWAFGSTENYLAFVNPFTKTLGMKNTVIADASGYSPATMSTASDLTLLAEIAMNHPVISEIVAQPQAVLPVAGTVYNVNYQLGSDGIVGIKTGNTDQAGGVYMFAATRPIDESNNVTVVGTIMGADNLSIAIADSKPLLDEAFKNFRVTSIVTANQVVAKLSQTGGKQIDIVTSDGLSVVSWTGQQIKIETTQLPLGSTIKSNETVGILQIQTGNKTHEVNLNATETIAGQTQLWRLRHGGGYF